MKKLQALLKLASLVEDSPENETGILTVETRALSGQYIVVLDRGFIYVGDISREGDFLKISKAKNIRIWGTEKGLGQLASGPTAKTVCDDVGKVLAPFKSIIHLVPCKGF